MDPCCWWQISPCDDKGGRRSKGWHHRWRHGEEETNGKGYLHVVAGTYTDGDFRWQWMMRWRMEWRLLIHVRLQFLGEDASPTFLPATWQQNVSGRPSVAQKALFLYPTNFTDTRVRRRGYRMRGKTIFLCYSTNIFQNSNEDVIANPDRRRLQRQIL